MIDHDRVTEFRGAEAHAIVAPDGQHFVGAIVTRKSREHRTERTLDGEATVYRITANPDESDYSFNFFRVAPSGTRGVFSTTRGSLPLRRLGQYLRKPFFNDAVKKSRDELMQFYVNRGNCSKSQAKIRADKEMPLGKTLVLLPCIRETAFEQLLKEIAEFEFFAFKFPESDDDQFSNARSVTSSVLATYRFSRANQSLSAVIDVIRKSISQFGLRSGRARGLDAKGNPKTVNINERQIALESHEFSKFVTGNDLSRDSLLEFPAVVNLKDVMADNPDLFPV
jgi:hypothetical protein